MPVTLSIDRNSQCNPTLWLIDVVPVAALQNRMPWPLLVLLATHSKGGVLFSAKQILQKSVYISTTTFWEETKCVWKMKLVKIWDHKCDSNNHWPKIGNSVSKHSAHFLVPRSQNGAVWGCKRGQDSVIPVTSLTRRYCGDTNKEEQQKKKGQFKKFSKWPLLKICL